MKNKILRNAQLMNEVSLKDITIKNEMIKEISDVNEVKADINTEEIDLKGKVVLPGFIDIHMHLDKSFTYPTIQNKSGTLMEAIIRFEQYEKFITTDMLVSNMSKGVSNAIRYGTTALRTHLDGGSPEYIRMVVEAYNEVKEKFAKFIDMEAVMMCPFNMEQGLEKDIRWAINNGIDCVGGAHHLSDHPQQNLDTIFDIGVSMDVDIDLHVDESDDPNVNTLPEICKKTMESGYQGRVIAGHCTSLSAMREEESHLILEKVKEANIGIVTLPGANLYLLGRDDKGLIRRGLTRVSDIIEHGIPIAIGSDNIQDPFHPYGKADLLQMALLGSYGAQMTSELQSSQLFEMISTVPGNLMNRDHGLSIGKKADFVILKTKNPKLVLSEQTSEREVWKNGKMVCRVTEEVTFETEAHSLFI